MSVIEPGCGSVCDATSACGCKPPERVEAKGPRVAAATALAAVACAACCVLPVALPSVVLGIAGGFLAFLDHAHGWITKAAIVIVIIAWMSIAWQIMRRKRRMTRTAAALMIFATVLTATASAWPLLEPLAFSALGFQKGVQRSG